MIEPLEARIAPAIVINNPLPDIVAGVGKTGATVDLSKLTAPASSSAYHTRVQFTTNYDTDPNTAGIQGGVIELELYDDLAPLTVQNFLAYVNNPDTTGDFDNVLFHRAVPNFVLQGGSFYQTGSGLAQIPTFPQVHNEPDIVNRSNVEGTVAMAKVSAEDGGGPNSATSAWFISLKDNNTGTADNGNLDLQNGGFTVFGKVTPASLALAKQISALPLINVGVGATTPAQNGTPIKIVDSTVIAPSPVSSSLTYTLDSIVPVGATSSKNLVTGKITGTQLALKYTPGASGLADVTVKIKDGTETKLETFRVDVRPNLIFQHADDEILVPGDATPLKFSIQNNGAVPVKGPVTVKLSMVKVGDASNTVVDLGLQVIQANLASGASQTVSVKALLPQTPATADNETWTVKAEIVGVKNERFTDDNLATGSTLGKHELANVFGTIDGRSNVTLKYKVGTTLYTWSMKGPGAGQLNPEGANKFSLVTANTTTASTPVVVVPQSVRVPLTSIDFNAAIGTVSLPSVDVSGSIMASGGVKSLTLGNVGSATSDSLMLIGSLLSDSAAKATLKFGSVTNFSIESDMPLASLTATSWVDPSGPKDRLTAPSLGSIKILGELAANVSLGDETATTAVAIGGLLRNSTFQTAGNLGAVTVGGIQGSKIYAGVDATPTSLSDLASAKSILSFTVLGTPTTQSELFKESVIAAKTIGSIKVKGVVEGGTTDLYGFIADIVKSYSRTTGTGAPKTASNLSAAASFDDLGSYVVKVL